MQSDRGRSLDLPPGIRFELMPKRSDLSVKIGREVAEPTDATEQLYGRHRRADRQQIEVGDAELRGRFERKACSWPGPFADFGLLTAVRFAACDMEPPALIPRTRKFGRGAGGHRALGVGCVPGKFA